MIKEFVKDKGSSSWGFHKFVNRDFLLNESNGLLINNKLTIFCEAEISELRSENHDNSETSINITIPQSKLVSNYCNMFESSLFTDCIIRVEGTEIKAHKAVLAAQSSVFYEVFCNSKEEAQTDVVEIKDFRSEVVREMLRYIYTENVSNIQNIAGDVLAIADRYKLDRLKAISERSLCYSLDIMNVCERFALSEKYSTGTLQECCQELILDNAAWLAKTKEWKKFVLVRPLLLESLFLKSLNTSSTGNI
uniref:BTB domain-containing protein n=1 Tax=Strongyloides papillosus TaxID=174720 RepID=A0A0N5C282_STREA